MMNQRLSHEKLQVYVKALAFTGKAASWTNSWTKMHAVTDHLCRASESILLNLAEAARRRDSGSRLNILDYAVGSTLECAACLDIAKVKQLMAQQSWQQEKRLLCEIAKMLIGLRKAWGRFGLREDSPDYESPQIETEGAVLFHHERLDVYQTALSLME